MYNIIMKWSGSDGVEEVEEAGYVYFGELGKIT